MVYKKIIMHADMDAFYASVEQRDCPKLKGKPVIVGGSSARGVVSAASYEARKFGVHSAISVAEARKLCPEGYFLRGDMKKYRNESKKIFEIFRKYSPAVEGISLDEAFLDLTGTERLLGLPSKIGESIRRDVREKRDLAVSVGVGPIKLIAKIASGLAKPDGLLEVPVHGIKDFLEPLSVAQLWGVGPVAQERLKALGMNTIGDLASADLEMIRSCLGVWGVEVSALARGEDAREVCAYRDPVSMSEENTFPVDISDLQTLSNAIRVHSEAVARRLRASKFVAKTVILKLKLANRVRSGPRGYPTFTRRKTLKETTNDGALISRETNLLLNEYSLSKPVRLIGVGVTNLSVESEKQINLFGSRDTESRADHLNKALDVINVKYGENAVIRGGKALSKDSLSFQVKIGEDDM